MAAPSPELLDLLTSLANDPNNVVYIISGRSKQNLQDWFGHIKNLGLAAEHGYYIRAPLKWHQEKQAMLRRKEVESHISLESLSNQLEEQQLNALYLEDVDTTIQGSGRVVIMPRAQSADNFQGIGRSGLKSPPGGLFAALRPITSPEANEGNVGPTARLGARSRQASVDMEESPLHYVCGTETDDSFEDFGPDLGWELQVKNLDLTWKDEVISTLEDITKRTPGSFVECKECSVTWHFRDADFEFGFTQAKTLQLHFNHILQHMPVRVLTALQKRYLIVVPRKVNKGRAVQQILADHESVGDRFDLIIAFGDERTDEDMFDVLQGNYCFTCTVGRKTTRATYFVDSVEEVLVALQALNQVSMHERELRLGSYPSNGAVRSASASHPDLTRVNGGSKQHEGVRRSVSRDVLRY